MTVAKWIDDGILPGHTTPGGHRRVSASDLVPFLERHSMRVPSTLLENDKTRVLAVHRDPQYLHRVASALVHTANRYEFRATTRGVDALVMIGEWHPSVILLDLHLCDVDSVQICRGLSSQEGASVAKVIAVAGDDDYETATAAVGAGAAMWVEQAQLPERVVELLSDVLSINDRRGHGSRA